MRRAILLALMIGFSLLAGCASQSGRKEDVEAKRREMSEAGTLSFTADVSANLGESVFECSVKCVRENGETQLTVLKPELASGISARIKDGETYLAYDGLELSVGTLQGSSLTPVGCIPALLDAMLNGFIEGISSEEYDGVQALAVRVYVDEESSAIIWFDSSALTPLKAELICSGTAAAGCTINDFTID